MTNSLSGALEKVHSGIGQGSVLEQIDKRYRKQQRLTLFKMLEKVEAGEVAHFPVELYRSIPQGGKNSLRRCAFPCRCGNITTRSSGSPWGTM